MKKSLIVVIFLLIFIAVLLVIAISNFANNKSTRKNSKTEIKENEIYTDDNNEKENNNQKEGKVSMHLNIIVGNKAFTATLEDNETSRKFIAMLPIEIDMSELNGNEKYYYLEKELPTNPYYPKKINNGDIMLFENSCLVLFYKSFNTSYSYTKLGNIDNPSGLESVLGTGNVKVKFESS